MTRWLPRTILLGVLFAAAAMFLARHPPRWLLGEEGGRHAAETALVSERAVAQRSGTGSDPPAAILVGRQRTDMATSTSEIPAPVDLTAVDRERDLHGVVVDGSGGPVAGAALVAVTYPFDRASILAWDLMYDAVEGPRTRSAADGTFAIRLRRGETVALRVRANGLAAIERPSCLAGERVRIVLRPGVSVVVEASTPSDEPAADVSFSLWSSGTRGHVAFHRSGTTGSEGRVRFDDLPPGVSATLEVERSRWASPEFYRSVRTPEAGEATLSVRLLPGRTITGRVTDAETGAPIPRANVGMGHWLGGAVETDADGRYTLTGWGSAGIHEVQALAEGYGRGQSVVGNLHVLDFALEKGDRVRGRVIDPDRRPVVGAVVAAIGSSFEGASQTTSTAHGRTGPDGRFELTGLRRDLPHALVAMASGYGRTLVDFDPHPGAAGDIDLGDVVLPVGRTLSGRVLRHDGEPIPNASVEMQGANDDRGRLRPGAEALPATYYGTSEERTTAEDGRFAFLDLAPGTYEIEAWIPGMPSVHATVRIGSDRDPPPVELRLAAGRSLRVTVVDDDGVPVPWACVSVEGGGGSHNMVTPLGESGSTTLLVPDSVNAVTVMTFGEGGTDPRRFVDQDLEFPIDPTSSELRCVLRQGVALAGRVIGPDGAPLAGVRLAIRKDGQVVAWASANDEGRFDATVSRGGPYEVLLDGSVGSWPDSRASGFSGAILDVPGGATDVLLQAHVVARDRKQVVRVVDPDGRPVAGAAVEAEWARPVGSVQVTTNAGGSAEFSGLPDLLCFWKAVPPANAADLVPSYAPEPSVPSSSPIEVRLRRGLRIRGRVIVPQAARGQAIQLEVTQGRTIGRTKDLGSSETTFTLLLDPEDGLTGSVVVRTGTRESPTFLARLDAVRFGPEEIVLRLAPVN